MSVFGSPIVQSAAGITQAERTTARDVERKKTAQAPARARAADAVEVHSPESADAVSDAAGSGQKETGRDDRRRSTPRPENKGEPAPKHLDVQG